MHNRAGSAVAVLVAALLTSFGPGPTAAVAEGIAPRPVHVAPSDAAVIDRFRPPTTRWAAGNRGIDFDTAPGSPVRASAAGEVTFAGLVAGSHHVVVLHPGGLRTSYSFLESVLVRRGDTVAQGATVGIAGGPLHFGVRAGDEYLDPAALLTGELMVHLVPDGDRRPAEAAAERSALVRFLHSSARRAADGAGQAWSWAREKAEPSLAELRGALHYAWEATPVPRAYRLTTGAIDWRRRQRRCTPVEVPTPRLTERRMVVLVAGLGSSSSRAAIDDVDTGALGYAAGDVVRFSYNGGTVTDHPYSAADTTRDLRVSARHLRELLERLGVEQPGVPIDVIAHSQGGVVARAALTDELDGLDRRIPPVRTLVTLASPHRGSDVATAATMIQRSESGEAAEKLLADILDNGIAPDAPAVRQLAETSTFVRELRNRPLPAGLRATSIAARGDLLVAAGRTRLPGAESTTLAPPGLLTDHGDLPGSPAAHREMALSVAGLAPTCEALGDAIADLVVSESIAWAEDMAGAGLWLGGRRLDRRARGGSGPRSPRPKSAPRPGKAISVPVPTRKGP